MLQAFKAWIITNLVMWLSIIGGWGVALYWHHRAARETDDMRDSRFGIFLIACINVLRFFAFTLLFWIIFTALWYCAKIVVLSHTSLVADPAVWQQTFEAAIAFAFQPSFYFVVISTFAACAVTAALSCALFFKRFSTQQPFDAIGFLDTLLVAYFAITMLLLSSGIMNR